MDDDIGSGDLGKGGHPYPQAPGEMNISRTDHVNIVTGPNLPGAWAHGICGCFDNGVICIITYFVPCVTFGKVAEGLGKSCGLYGTLYIIPILNCILWVQNRGQLRSLRRIPGSAIGDCCLICWCTLCALAQEGQEVEQMQREEIQRNQTQFVVVANPGGMAHQQPAGSNVVVQYVNTPGAPGVTQQYQQPVPVQYQQPQPIPVQYQPPQPYGQPNTEPPPQYAPYNPPYNPEYSEKTDMQRV